MSPCWVALCAVGVGSLVLCGLVLVVCVSDFVDRCLLLL